MKVIKKLKKMKSGGKKALALIIVGAIIGGAKGCVSQKTSKKIYLVDIKDKYQNELILKDKDGNPIELMECDKEDLLAIVSEKKFKDNKDYQVVLVSDTGKMQSGYVEGKFLDEDVLDTEQISKDVFDDEAVVTATKGAWLREKPIVDKETENATYLDKKQNVISSSVTISNGEDSYLWNQGIAYKDKDIKVGYIASDYIASKKFDNIKGKRFVVSTKNNIPLKLRSEANKDAEVICSIPSNNEVILLNSYPSVSDDEHDWFYVAVNTDNGVKFGYVCATYYGKKGTIHYLVEKIHENEDNSKKILIEVNTDKDNGIPLKLRDGIGTTSRIISELSNKTKIYTTSYDINEIEKNIDDKNNKWLKVSLVTGEVGYVRYDYINNVKVKESMDDEVYTLNFGKEGKKEGYFGIDIENKTNYIAFEKLLKNNNYYSDDERGLKVNCKPSFVIIKLGATGYGTKFGKDNIAFAPVEEANLERLVNLCEEYEIPFGFYYFSQAITINEAEKEVEHIKKLSDKYKNYTHNILPIYYDYELSSNDTRLATYAKKGHKEELTNVLNYAMNKLRLETEKEVCLYTDGNALGFIFDYNKLDDINKKNPWIVEASNEGHSNRLAEKYPEVVENMGMRQIKLDKEFGNEEKVKMDLNLMNKDYFENILKNTLGISKNNTR